MNKPVIITADSSADLPPSLREECDIRFFPLYISLEGKFYKDCVDIFPDDIYAAYKERQVFPKTAAPSIGEYQSFFSGFTEQGCAVVHLSLSHTISSCAHVSQLAAEELEDVHVVDSNSFCTGSGMVVMQACRLRDEGYSAAEIAQRLLELRKKVRAYFILDTLDFIKQGGRCSALQAFGATLLGLRPTVTVKSETGELVIGKKYRNKRPIAYEAFLRDCIANLRGIIDTSLVFFMHTPDMPPQEYEPLNALVRELLPEVRRLVVDTIGCTIVSHCGENCLAFVAFEK
ncbi:MAG: DegV family protein [Oscillospiraceae bacterium]|jgi:DegV family protein with EDD domain|nr:DegV family protein [Oscillospiraceae bacterium]